MRRGVLAAAAAAAGIAVAAPCASAGTIPARVVTWTTSSRYVDVSGPTPFNRPPGAAARPNALRVNVYLPAGYDGKRRFPILWLLHGHGDAYDSWINPQQGDFLHIAAGFPGIVVMPEGAQGWYTDWWEGGARRPGWESYYLNELMPLVQQRLRILPGRSNHAIAGLSMGGEGAVYFAEQRPGYFGSVATFSGCVSIQRSEWPTGFNTQGQDYATVFGPVDGFYATGHNPTALAGNLQYSRLFVSVGNGVPAPAEASNSFGAVAETELQFHATDLLSAARAAGAQTSYIHHQGIHAWTYWRQDLVNALKWGFFKPVAEAPTSWAYTTVDQHAAAWGLHFDFAAPPMAVERFTRSGRTLSGSGVGTVTVTVGGRAGTRFTATLPFSRTLPAPRAAARRPRTRR